MVTARLHAVYNKIIMHLRAYKPNLTWIYRRKTIEQNVRSE